MTATHSICPAELVMDAKFDEGTAPVPAVRHDARPVEPAQALPPPSEPVYLDDLSYPPAGFTDALLVTFATDDD